MIGMHFLTVDQRASPFLFCVARRALAGLPKERISPDVPHAFWSVCGERNVSRRHEIMTIRRETTNALYWPLTHEIPAPMFWPCDDAESVHRS